MIAIAQQIFGTGRAPIIGIEREPGQMIGDELPRHSGFACHLAQRGEGQGDIGVAVQCGGGQGPQLQLRGDWIGGCHGTVAQFLAIGHVIGGAAPGVKQPCPLARCRVEQLAGGGKALRALRDRCCSGGDQFGPIGHRRSSAFMAAPIGTGGRPERIRIRSVPLGVPA